ncbi:MAG: hypothetical protein PUE64_05135 [Firmicutes bacterium]|nr:hypothetical protein [Bacillota bacterium]
MPTLRRRGSCWSFCFCSVLARGNLPKFYLACGTEDVLLGVNRSFRDVLREGGADVTYVEESGGHDRDFWNRQIQEALDRLPLDAAKEGISSGHVTGNQKLHTSAFTLPVHRHREGFLFSFPICYNGDLQRMLLKPGGAG